MNASTENTREREAFAEMNVILDSMLAVIRSTRLNVQENLAKIEEMKSKRV